MSGKSENTIVIALKGVFIPVGDVSIRVYDTNREYAVYKDIILHFSTDSNTITAERKLSISEDELTYIKSTDPDKPVNEGLVDKVLLLYYDVQEFVAYIRAFDAVFELDPELRMHASYEMSEDFKQYIPLNIKFRTRWRGANLVNTIGDNVMGNLNRITAAGYPLFTAFKFLYQAYADTNTKFKWINATIAAEQAFKEFISVLDDRTESIMLNVPSPPIEKLYNNVLQAYTGFSSSVYKELQKGAATRNALIHKHKTEAPTLKETNIYIHQVEVAVFELYTCLYPKDEYFTFLLNKAKQRLDHVVKGGGHFQ